ncbi:DUF2306 domain-containing protein [Paenibacillus sp. strain BS8-2]
MKSTRLITVTIVVISIYLAYVLSDNYLLDPQAKQFLALKTGLDKPLNLPVWLNVMYVHVGFATLAVSTGVINFIQSIRVRWPRFHRANGYLYVISVMLVVLTSGYMAPYATGGKAVSIAFNMMNIVWPAFTVLSLIRIRRKDIPGHRRWMIRSYMFCFNNIFVHAMTYVIQESFRLPYETSYSAGVYAAFALNLLTAELILRLYFPKPRTNKTSIPPSP